MSSASLNIHDTENIDNPDLESVFSLFGKGVIQMLRKILNQQVFFDEFRAQIKLIQGQIESLQTATDEIESKVMAKVQSMKPTVYTRDGIPLDDSLESIKNDVNLTNTKVYQISDICVKLEEDISGKAEKVELTPMESTIKTNEEKIEKIFLMMKDINQEIEKSREETNSSQDRIFELIKKSAPQEDVDMSKYVTRDELETILMIRISEEVKLIKEKYDQKEDSASEGESDNANGIDDQKEIEEEKESKSEQRRGETEQQEPLGVQVEAKSKEQESSSNETVESPEGTSSQESQIEQEKSIQSEHSQRIESEHSQKIESEHSQKIESEHSQRIESEQKEKSSSEQTQDSSEEATKEMKEAEETTKETKRTEETILQTKSSEKVVKKEEKTQKPRKTPKKQETTHQDQQQNVPVINEQRITQSVYDQILPRIESIILDTLSATQATIPMDKNDAKEVLSELNTLQDLRKEVQSVRNRVGMKYDSTIAERELSQRVTREELMTILKELFPENQSIQQYVTLEEISRPAKLTVGSIGHKERKEMTAASLVIPRKKTKQDKYLIPARDSKFFSMNQRYLRGSDGNYYLKDMGIELPSEAPNILGETAQLDAVIDFIPFKDEDKILERLTTPQHGTV